MWFHFDARQPRFIVPPCVPILQPELLLATNAGRSYLLRDTENGLICCWHQLNTWRPLPPPPIGYHPTPPGTSTRTQHRREARINTMTCRLARLLARPGFSTPMPSPPPASAPLRPKPHLHHECPNLPEPRISVAQADSPPIKLSAQLPQDFVLPPSRHAARPATSSRLTDDEKTPRHLDIRGLLLMQTIRGPSTAHQWTHPRG